VYEEVSSLKVQKYYGIYLENQGRKEGTNYFIDLPWIKLCME